MAEEIGKAKIGFVGCGGFSTGSLYPTLHLIPEFDLAAVCDLQEDLAKRNARNFGAGNVYTDLDKMLEWEELDGAVVVGLPKMHYEIGKRCLDAGLPIYVEKPSALTYVKALELAEYAESKGLFGAIGFMKRNSTCYKMAKAIVEKEEFGSVNEIEVRFSNGRYPDLKSCGLDKGPANAYLIGQAVHVFDLIRFFSDDVEEIYAVLNNGKSFDDGSATFGYAVTLKFKNGSIGVMNLSAFHCPNFQMSEYFLAAGDECWLEVRDMMALNYHARQKPIPEFNPDGRAQIFSWRPEFTEVGGSTAGGLIGYKGEMQNFARATLGIEKPSANLFDGAEALKIAEAIWESSQIKKPVKLD